MTDNNTQQNTVTNTEIVDDTIPAFFFQAIRNETMRAHRQIEIINKEKQIIIDFISEQVKNPAIRSEKDLENAIIQFIIDSHLQKNQQ